MPSKNDLSALKGPQTDKGAILPSNDRKPEPEARGPITGKPIGRPKKKAAEKRDYKVTLSLTQAEGAAIAEQAGLAGDATYVYHKLKEAGVI